MLAQDRVATPLGYNTDHACDWKIFEARCASLSVATLINLKFFAVQFFFVKSLPSMGVGDVGCACEGSLEAVHVAMPL